MYADPLVKRLSTNPVVIDSDEEERTLRDKIALCEKSEHAIRQRIDKLRENIEAVGEHPVLMSKLIAAGRDLAWEEDARIGYMSRLENLLRPEPPQAGSVLDRMHAMEAELELTRLRLENAELRKRKGKAQNAD